MEKPMGFQQRCIRFSAQVLQLTSVLPKSLASRTIADQLLRSGTSVGANAHEARSAESRADFIHKMQIALKESRETQYWLALIQQAKLLETVRIDPVLQECNEITAILAQSVITAKKNAQ